MIPEMVPDNDNAPIPKYETNWGELFLIVTCSLLAVGIGGYGILCIPYVIAHL